MESTTVTFVTRTSNDLNLLDTRALVKLYDALQSLIIMSSNLITKDQEKLMGARDTIVALLRSRAKSAQETLDLIPEILR